MDLRAKDITTRPPAIFNVDAQPSSPHQATLSSRLDPEEEHLVHIIFLEQ